MPRPTDSDSARQAEAERKLLAALCQDAVDSPMRAAVMRRLNKHRFAHPDHEVISRALAALPRGEPAEIRAKLAEAVTRLGFPDLEIDFLFETPPPSAEDLTASLEELT
jgi:hypothetical protein